VETQHRETSARKDRTRYTVHQMLTIRGWDRTPMIPLLEVAGRQGEWPKAAVSVEDKAPSGRSIEIARNDVRSQI
jgi:hypothetical protein